MYPPTKNVHVEPVKVEISELKGNSSLILMLMAAQQSAINFEIKNCVNNLLDKVEIELSAENCQACVNEIFIFLMIILFIEVIVKLAKMINSFISIML